MNRHPSIQNLGQYLVDLNSPYIQSAFTEVKHQLYRGHWPSEKLLNAAISELEYRAKHYKYRACFDRRIKALKQFKLNHY